MRSKSRHCQYGEEHAATRVVFVHGFGGHPKLTWGRFPTLLADDPDLPQLSVKSWGYVSGLLRRCPGIAQLADQLMTYLSVGQSKPEHIILVGHSIGGLVLLQAVVTELVGERAREYPVNRVERIALFATPLAGILVRKVLHHIITSPMGFLARHLLRNRQLIDLYNLDLVTKLASLVVNRVYHREAGRVADSRRHVAIHTFVADGDGVVTEAAVRAWFERPPPRCIPETNHTTVKLPSDRKATSYEALRDVVNEVVNPWFHRLAKLARNRSHPRNVTAIADLQRAYVRALQVRLDAVVGEPDWNSWRREREQRKFLALVLREAKLRPVAPVAAVLDNLLIYCG